MNNAEFLPYEGDQRQSIDPKITKILERFATSALRRIQEKPEEIMGYVDMWTNMEPSPLEKNKLALPEVVIRSATEELRDNLSLYIRNKSTRAHYQLHEAVEDYLGGVVGVSQEISKALIAIRGETDREIVETPLFDSPELQTELGYSLEDMAEKYLTEQAEYAATEQLLRQDETAFALIENYVSRLKKDPKESPYTIKGAEMAEKMYKTLFPLALSYWQTK